MGTKTSNEGTVKFNCDCIDIFYCEVIDVLLNIYIWLCLINIL